MKYTKKKMQSKTTLVAHLQKSNSEAEATLDLVAKFPLKESMEIITRNSGWDIAKHPERVDKGIASFVLIQTI